MKMFVSTLLLVSAAVLSGGGGAHAQSAVTEQNLVSDLQALSNRATVLDINKMQQEVLVEISTQHSEEAVNRTKYLDYFTNLPNFDVEILFAFDSDFIEPVSYPILGAMADALHNPILLGDQFLIVGHTDAKGDREYNLKLSQRRADVIREALVTTFRIAPDRIQAFGLGEEQLKDPSNPDGAVNRRVQLINLGPMQ
jgi:outer membrane protein OmpA-like peptidoglycan-associated protein